MYIKEKKKVYFAGGVCCGHSCAEDDWRTKLLSVDISENCSGGMSLNTEYCDYAGPFLITEWNEGYDYSTACCLMDQLSSADYVFAWIEKLNCYGTIFELGYAYNAGIPTFVYYDAGIDAIYDCYGGHGYGNTAHWIAQSLSTICKSADTPQEAYNDFLHRIYPPFESPIEEKLYNALIISKPNDFSIILQKNILQYRLDMAISFNKNNEILCAIECDGHDFHEKTKEQAAHDKKRDRDLLIQGIPTLRFTGTEIYRDAKNCANDVWCFIQNNKLYQQRA